MTNNHQNDHSPTTSSTVSGGRVGSTESIVLSMYSIELETKCLGVL